MTLIKFMRYIVLFVLCVTQISQPAFCNAVQQTVTKDQDAAIIKKAQEKLKKLSREAIDSLTAGDLEGQAANSKFIELYKRDFDQEKIASLMLSHYWGTGKANDEQKGRMNAEQKKRFLAVQPQKLAKIYSSRFRDYQGVDFKIMRGWINNVAQKTVVISTSVQKPGGQLLRVNWYLTAEEKIYDIVIEGISMIKTFRDQYKAALSQRNNNIEAFLNNLDGIVVTE